MSDLHRHIDTANQFQKALPHEPRPTNNAPATATILEMCRRRKEAPKIEEPAPKAPITPMIF